jgi:hypothetical protein
LTTGHLHDCGWPVCVEARCNLSSLSLMALATTVYVKMEKSTMSKFISKRLFFDRKIFPAMWFGFIGFVLVRSWFSKIRYDTSDLLFVVAACVFMTIFGYFIMKVLVFDLIDEVYDEGTTLLFRKGGKDVDRHAKMTHFWG